MPPIHFLQIVNCLVMGTLATLYPNDDGISDQEPHDLNTSGRLNARGFVSSSCCRDVLALKDILIYCYKATIYK